MCIFFPAWLRQSCVVCGFTHPSAAKKYDNPIASGKMKISSTVLSWNSVHLGFWILTAIILFPTAGCASGPAPPTAAKVNRSPFYPGADISTLSEVDERGGIYMDGDKPGDALAIFMKNGWTCFRLRIRVDPRNGVNGLAYTTKPPNESRPPAGRSCLIFVTPTGGLTRRSRTNPPRGQIWILTTWLNKPKVIQHTSSRR